MLSEYWTFTYIVVHVHVRSMTKLEIIRAGKENNVH